MNFTSKALMNLPIGIQDFKQLREGGFVYIDKTDLALQLIELGQPLFLTRPRRFGKSLLLSVMHYAFLGKKHLFEGLHIYDKHDFKPFPVLHLDFSIIGRLKEDDFAGEFLEKIQKFSEKNNFFEKKVDVRLQMSALLDFFNKNNQKLVLIIDEYDKPLVDNLDDIPTARRNQVILRNFYEVVKAQGTDIQFTMITGITKFSQLSLFSSMNQLRDISLDKRFATVCGYTQQEIDSYFPKFYTNIHEEYPGKDLDFVKNNIKQWYNGHNFGGNERVYNPFAILNIADSLVLINYWYETGNPRWLFQLMKAKNLSHNIVPMRINAKHIRSFDIENINFETVLFQTGYLTIIDYDSWKHIYTLDFPNREVKENFYDGLLEEYTETKSSNVSTTIDTLRDALEKNDLENIFDQINVLFASIPHQIFLAKYEAYYHSILHTLFSLMNYWVESEVSTSKGRIDTVLQTATHIYIIEFKIDRTNEKTAEHAALKQIKDNQYAAKFANSRKQIVLIGVALGIEERGVIAYIVENL